MLNEADSEECTVRVSNLIQKVRDMFRFDSGKSLILIQVNTDGFKADNV
jgi:hypothetical protein